ncbi:MAG: Inner membrane ABC transporter permease protein YdcV [Actinobacteria bacterium ADurb.Bin346]|nr:MAG: Inner membrane ABC transporter permease protein YdcV [Actinobacteria bacterium ADurb.Bin346]
MKKEKPVFLTIYTVLFFLYVFAPLIIIFIFAFNAGEGYNLPLKGLTFNWFEEFFSDSIALNSIKNSLIIAMISATISTLLGTGLTIGIIKGIARFRAFFITVLMLPVLMPSLTIGIAALVFFRTINIPLGIPIVILSHVSISISYVFLIMMGRVEGYCMDVQEAAVDLGAGWFASLRDVVLPAIFPAILAGWLFSFMISWNEFIVTYFLIGTEVTLPIYIFSQLRFGISPKVNVIALLITMFTIVIIITTGLIRKIYIRINARLTL